MRKAKGKTGNVTWAATGVGGCSTGCEGRTRAEEFVPLLERASCPNMKLVTAEKILWSLEDKGPVIDVDEEIASRARGAVERMLVPGREEGTPKG